MSYAPKRLLELRDYMKPLTGLSDAELGIVGDVNHDGYYHCGWDRRRIVNGVLRDYSWLESTRDSSHKTDAASAFDCGYFARLREMSIWIVGECEKGAPDTLDIREIIYSPDGVTVKRWDRLGKRTSGDSSHIKHTHFSYFRDAEDRAKTAVFQRFFEGDDTMFCAYGDNSDKVKAMQLQLLQLDAACLPTFGADSGYGEETRVALSRLVTGGDAKVYGPDGFALLQMLIAQKFGGGKGEKGDKGDPGSPGAPGKTPTEVTFGPTTARVTAAG